MAKKQDKTKAIFGLRKLSDAEIIKRLLIEKGKTDSYIQELEHDNEELRARLSQYEKQ